jgi:hypothetical protein
MHLKNGQIVGQWRDSTYGIGGGRIPFDVNTALVPAALRSIASLSKGGIFDFNATVVDSYAQVWEDYSLELFEVNVPLSTAQSLLENYVNVSGIAGRTSLSLGSERHCSWPSVFGLQLSITSSKFTWRYSASHCF